MKYILCVLALLLAGCGAKPETRAYQQPPAEVAQPGPCSHFMSNDEIIASTKHCENNGLLAEALHCGDDKRIVIVQCKPKAE